MRNGFKVFKYENKIINEYNEFFEKDVLYYKDLKNTIVYYDAVTNQYLGYKLNNKIIKQKSTAYLNRSQINRIVPFKKRSELGRSL